MLNSFHNSCCVSGSVDEFKCECLKFLMNFNYSVVFTYISSQDELVCHRLFNFINNHIKVHSNSSIVNILNVQSHCSYYIIYLATTYSLRYRVPSEYILKADRCGEVKRIVAEVQRKIQGIIYGLV